MPPLSLIRHPWIIPCALLLLAVLAYVNSFPGAFILDDIDIAARSSLVNNPDVLAIFRSDYWHIPANSGLYRPLTILSLAINRLLLGPEPWAFHLANVLLHALVTMLIWQALRTRGGDSVGAIVAAGLFAVHPIHAEVVNVVVGRSELLVALFLLAGFVAARRNGAVAWSLTCACFLLALLSKEHAITFLVLLPLWDLFGEGSFRAWRGRWPLYAGLAAIAGFWLLWREYGVIRRLPMARFSEAAAPLAHVDGMTRVLTALQHQWLYLGKLFVPIKLQTVYSIADMPAFIRAPWSWQSLLVIAGTLGALLLLVWGWRRHQPVALFGVLYLVAFLPTSNLLFPIGVTMAERLAYFPSVWFCAGLGTATAAVLASQRWNRWSWLGLVACLVWWGGITLRRNPDFNDSVRLWRAEVAQNPVDFLGWQNLAKSLAQSGQFDEADAAFRTMLEQAPDYPGGLRSRTAFFLERGVYEQASPTAQRVFAISQANNDYWGMAFDGLDLAEISLSLGKCGDALTYLDGPSLPLRDQYRYLDLRGMALVCLERDAEAVDVLALADRERLPYQPGYLYALSLYRLGRYVEARGQLERAARNGGNAEAWNLLGAVNVKLGDLPAALKAFEAAVGLEPGNPRYRENLERVQRLR